MKSFQKKTEKWKNTDTSKGINQLLCPGWLHFYKKKNTMDELSDVSSQEKREHSCSEMGNTAAPFPDFFFPHYSFHTRASRIKDQHRLPCSRILMSMGLVPAEKIRHN